MQKTATLKNFKVFLFKTLLLSIVLSISFKASIAQEGLSKPASAEKNKPTERSAALQQQTNNVKLFGKNAKADASPALAGGTSSEPTDVPEKNQQFAATQKPIQTGPNAVPSVLPVPNGLAACVFNGSLTTGDATLSAGRFFRDGISSVCGSTKVCPGAFGTGPYFYDAYTLKNISCASQCVTVTYLANGTTGNCFVTAYNGSFSPANLCTNYIADGGLSSLAAGTPVSFSFTLAASATVVLVVNEAVISEASDSYTMSVTAPSGLFCSGVAPVCQAPTASVLSQAGGLPVATTVFSEQFDGTIPPAGWPVQNLSAPLGLTGWSQTNSLVFPPQSGVGFASANFNNTAGTGTISNWMFSPNVTLKNGDRFTFWTRTTSGTFPDRLQVRMSTNGASTNAGTTATSVGDFSTLLLDINPTYTGTGYPTAWTQYTLTMSGLPAAGVSGRLAFRYFVESGGPTGANSDFIGIDNAVYTTFSEGPVTTCTGSTANLRVNITGGASALYDVTIHPSIGADFTVLNYASGSLIPVTPAVTTTYSIVKVVSADDPCCVGTGNSGTPTITVSATPIAPIVVTANPNTPLCAGDPTLLNVAQSPSTPLYSSTTPVLISSGPLTGTAAGVASPYPSTITVSGLPATGATVTSVTLNNLSHTWAGDLDILLQSPTGQNVILLSDFGGSNDFTNATLTFNDAGGTMVSANPIVSGTYKPVNTAGPDVFPAPGPGSITNINPTLATFTGNFNGVWNLFVNDQAGGDTGRIAGGYNIRFNVPGGPVPAGYTYYWSPAAGLSTTTSVPVAASPMQTTTYTVLATAPSGCQTTASITINVNQLPAVTQQPANVSVCAGQSATFTATASGAGISYQWQVSTNGGTTWTNLTNGAPYAGVTTTTLTVNPTTGLMNGYRYRLVVSGTCPPAATSAGAILTVKALPVVSYTPASPVCGGIAGVSGTQITAGSAPPPVPGSVTVSSGAISVAVPDNTANGVSTNLTVAGVPANATITNARVTFTMPHTWNGDMIFNLKAPNGTVLSLDKYLTGTGGAGATTGFVNTVISSAGTVALSAGTGTYTATFKPDLLNGPVAFPIQNPAGFPSTAASFADLYSTPNGIWTLAMADGGPGDLGTLTSWSITIDYTTPGATASPLTYTWSPAAGLYSNANATTPYIAGTQTNTVYAAPTTYTFYTITGSDASTGCVNTATVLVNYMPPKPTVVPASVVMCATDAPVRLTSSTSTTLNSTFTSGPISVIVPDNSPAGSTHAITASGIPANAVVTGAEVTFTMPHTWAGDVAIALRAPNGNIINLDYYLSGTGAGPSTGFVNTNISSTGTAALGAGANPWTGTFRADLAGTAANPPGGPTGNIPNVTTWPAFFGTTNGNGAWTLAMRDAFAGDQGTLTSWSIKLTYLVGTPASPATWSPIAGLFINTTGTPYTGDQRDTVYTLPASSTTYSVTVNGIGPDATPTFSNTGSIAIVDGSPGNPYPSNITVSGLPTTGVKVKNVVLSGINHTWSDDIDIVLQSPTGTNVTLMSDVGGADILTNTTYTFDDAGPAMSAAGGNLTGTFHVTNIAPADNYPAPGPGSVNDAPNLSNFTGNLNGVWKLFVVDDVFGDNGNISGGWNITFVYPTVGCTSAATLVPVTVNIPAAITVQPVNATVCTDKVTSFTVTATGTSPTHNWQYSTQTGNGNPGTWVTIANGGVFSGANSATLTITAPPVSMNGWLFRDSVRGAAPCGAAISLNARLNVNPLPVITIDASPYRRLFPGLKTTLTSTVAPAASTYTWLRNGTTVGGASGSNLIVDVDGLGEYRLRVTDVNGCTSTSNAVTVSDSVTGKVFIYPNPNSGQFQVRYHSVINNNGLPRGINVYDARGKRISTIGYSIASPYARMDVDLRNHGTGVYWIEVVDANGNRLAMGRVDVIR